MLEQWIDKICDLNYQILIDQSGGVEFLGVKESLVEQGVHQGHLMPSRLSEAQLGVIREAAVRIGEALYRDGYYGIAGMDAILDEDGTIWPNLEINARFNMSTYQLNIQQQYLPDGYYGLAKNTLFGFITCWSIRNFMPCWVNGCSDQRMERAC